MRCQTLTYQHRDIAWCGYDAGAGRVARKGYWELERNGDVLTFYAMNGEALRTLKEFNEGRFKAGYKRPYLNLNALDAAPLR